MERDFLGMKGKHAEDSRGKDSDFMGGSPLQWPFSTKATAFQQQVLFKPVQDEKPTKTAFDHHSTSGFRPVTPAECFDSKQKACPVRQTPQKCFNLHRQGFHEFSMPAYQPQSTEAFGTSTLNVVPNHSIPVATNSPFFKVYGPSSSSNLPMTSSKQQPFGAIAANNVSTMASGVGNLTPRNVSKPSLGSGQLTIFYAGSVNVFDAVPWEKAQAIMLLASKACKANSNALNQRPQPSIVPAVAPKESGVDYMTKSHIPTQTQNQNLMPSPIVSSPISITSHVGAHSRSCSSNTDEVARMRGMGQVLPPPIHREPTKTVTTSAPMVPRAVPQARKASLARFLEKRKERVTNTMPYFSAQKTPENSSGCEDASVISKSSSADVSLSSNQESWCLGQHRNSNSSGVSPSTKLEM